jgi:hypothetical protein
MDEAAGGSIGEFQQPGETPQQQHSTCRAGFPLQTKILSEKFSSLPLATPRFHRSGQPQCILQDSSLFWTVKTLASIHFPDSPQAKPRSQFHQTEKKFSVAFRARLHLRSSVCHLVGRR